MRRTVLKLVGIVLLLPLLSCRQRRSDSITIDEMLRSNGNPVVIGSGFSVNRSVPLLELSIYGVRQPVTREMIQHLSPGQIAVFCNDPRFVDAIEVHFATMHDPTQFSGNTAFAALLKNSTRVTIFQISEKGYAEQKFSEFVINTYFEVGDKDHLIRVRPSR